MAESREQLFSQLVKTIDETIELFETLVECETKKIDAIAVNDVARLEQYMNEEQAFVMKMKGLDQKREKQQKLLNLGDMTFRNMIEACQGQEQEILRERHALLLEKTEEVKTATAASKKYIELHLHGVDMLLSQIDQQNTAYDKNGEKIPPESASRFKPTKV